MVNKIKEFFEDEENAKAVLAGSIGWSAGWVAAGGLFYWKYQKDAKKIRAAVIGRIEVMANATKKMSDTMMDPMKDHDDLIKVIEEEQAFIDMVMQQPLY